MDGTVDQEENELSGDDLLSQEQRYQRWQSKRPVIDHLRDGLHVLADGSILPLFDVGDRIVVDCRTELLKGIPWLETRVGKVRSIDDETGVVTLWDEDSDPRSPTVRYVSVWSNLFIFKLAPLKGDPFEPPPPEKQQKLPRDPGQKGRGRPKGSKNRPKDVIKAEKAARKEGKA